jgi:hypothetical protein
VLPPGLRADDFVIRILHSRDGAVCEPVHTAGDRGSVISGIPTTPPRQRRLTGS